MRFDDYHISIEIKKSISKLGFTKPTDIQFKSIPSILKGDDVLAIAQTGTGKTAAFAIPIIDTLQKRKNMRRSDGIKCLIMVPTRELGMQIDKVLKDISKFTRIDTLCIFGGVEQENQIASLNKGVDILVATPGRMFDLVSQGHIDLHRIEILVLDEADHMLDLGFIKDIRDLMKHLPKRRQTLFFSATINKKIKELAYSLVTNPIHIRISPKDPVSKNVHHTLAYVEMDDKRYFLERIVKENPEAKILVFVRTKVRAERVASAMARVKIETITIHGDKDQKKRFEALKQFRDGDVKILIATDVSARGIDIPDVLFVVNYDLPEQAENYVHRVGRTGRGRNKGYAVSFCSEEEKELLSGIEEYIGNKVDVSAISKADHTETLDFSADNKYDWQKLIDDNEAEYKKKRVKTKFKGKGR